MRIRYRGRPIVSGETNQDTKKPLRFEPERYKWKGKCKLGRNDMDTLRRVV
jgi:hypothetical protein